MSATGSCSDAPSGDGWHLLFVYGTLKTGEKNNRLLETPRGNGRARLLGAAQTLEKLPLVVATEYNVPFLLAAKGTGEVLWVLIFMRSKKGDNARDFLPEGSTEVPIGNCVSTAQADPVSPEARAPCP